MLLPPVSRLPFSLDAHGAALVRNMEEYNDRAAILRQLAAEMLISFPNRRFQDAFFPPANSPSSPHLLSEVEDPTNVRQDDCLIIKKS